MNVRLSEFLNKKNVEMMAVIGLSIVLALVLKSRFMGDKTVTPPSSSTASSGHLWDSKPHAIEQGNVQPPHGPEELTTDKLSPTSPPSPASLRRDLFSPMNAAYDPLNLSKKGGAGSLALKATFPDSERPLAIFNDEVVGIGDTVQGYRVIEIRKDEVILLSGERERVFTLNEEEFK